MTTAYHRPEVAEIFPEREQLNPNHRREVAEIFPEREQPNPNRRPEVAEIFQGREQRNRPNHRPKSAAENSAARPARSILCYVGIAPRASVYQQSRRPPVAQFEKEVVRPRYEKLNLRKHPPLAATMPILPGVRLRFSVSRTVLSVVLNTIVSNPYPNVTRILTIPFSNEH